LLHAWPFAVSSLNLPQALLIFINQSWFIHASLSHASCSI
jgi:hypothetical protein